MNDEHPLARQSGERVLVVVVGVAHLEGGVYFSMLTWLPAKDSPVLHLRAAPGAGGLADYYRSAFERVWDCTHA